MTDDEIKQRLADVLRERKDDYTTDGLLNINAIIDDLWSVLNPYYEEAFRAMGGWPS